MEWDGAVVVAVGNERTRRRIEAALSDREVEVRDPTEWSVTDERARPGVAVVEADAAPQCDDRDGRDDTDDAVMVVTRGTADDRCRTLSRPVGPDAVRAAVDRAARRVAYAEGLDALTTAATSPARTGDDAARSPGPSAAFAPTASRLDEVLAEFDHEDFVAAFRTAVGEAH
ncbi:hypothetical protein [Haloparvum sedimenti]|uniref:hypothetical protein n=1 Tax=Haloparvum sedimenti TaxID=1678448 RepID=UPI00071E691B|nr:hypothetical protein [Haloparvum sedimenti]